MIRARIWFRCAAMHDPVTPRVAAPAILGWFGKNRQIDLTIEREFNGRELLSKMKGWITVSPKKAIEIFEKFGRLKTFDDGELIIEVETEEDFAEVLKETAENFHDQCDLERI